MVKYCTLNPATLTLVYLAKADTSPPKWVIGKILGWFWMKFTVLHTALTLKLYTVLYRLNPLDFSAGWLANLSVNDSIDLPNFSWRLGLKKILNCYAQHMHLDSMMSLKITAVLPPLMWTDFHIEIYTLNFMLGNNFCAIIRLPTYCTFNFAYLNCVYVWGALYSKRFTVYYITFLQCVGDKAMKWGATI